MNIKELHDAQKPVSLVDIFKSELGKVAAMRILQGEKLKEHITKVPALLICVDGKVVYETEKGVKEELTTGDFVEIEKMVKHWVIGITKSQLILIR